MTRCWRCGRPVREGTRACVHCGAPLNQPAGDQDSAWDDSYEAPARGSRGGGYGGRSRPPLPPPSSSRQRGGYGSGRGDSGDDGGRDPLDPLDDPRAPNVLRRGREGVPPPVRRDRDRDRDGYDWRGYPPPREQYPPARGGRASQPMEESAEYSAEYGTAGDSAQYSAEYGAPSAEYSAEYGTPGYSAEYGAQYPARRGYSEAYPVPDGEYDSRMDYPVPSARGARRRSSGWTEAPRRSSFPRGRAPSYAAAPSRKRAGWIVTAVIGLALVIIVAGAGYVERDKILARLRPAATTPPFATYTPGPTPTVVPSYKQYVSKNAGYVLNYPQSWTLSSIDAPSGGLPDYADTFEQTNPPAVFAIERAQIFDPLSDDGAIQAELRAAEKLGASFTSTGAATTVSVGGEHWTREEYDVLYHSTKWHYAFLATHHLGHSYVIALEALPGDFATEQSGAFAIILATFRFT